MNKQAKLMLGAGIVFMSAAALQPACAADKPEQALADRVVVSGDDVRLENAVEVRDASASLHGELHCNYLSASNGKTFVFKDGNRAVFPAGGTGGVRFVAAGGANTQIEAEGKSTLKSWWCQEDGVVLFSTVQAPEGGLGGVKVEWFDSKGMRRSATQVNLVPPGGQAIWSYAGARPVDDCLGLTFMVQENIASGAPGKARYIEYKLCPKGI
jgi:hypothetical protein